MSDNILIKVGADITNFSRNMKAASGELDKFQKANKDTFDAFKKVGAGITAGGIAIAGGLGIAVKEASDFQSAFAGVKKTVDTNAEGYAVLEKGIRDMAKELPASATEIAGVAESAGQLGIAEDNILGFTRTMIDLGEATNLTADEAATSFARFANITKMPQTEFDKLGSVVVDLGNNMATTEAEIVDMSMRLAAQGKQVGMSESEIMALAGTMSSLGIESEAGGSAMTQVLTKMQKAVLSGGEDLDSFAKAAGMTAKDFAESFKNDPVKALEQLSSGLGDSADAGGNMSAILEELGITGIREADVMKRLAGNSELLGEAVGIASNAWDENSALTNEASQRYETFESKMAMFKNTIKDVGISIGNVLLPFITTLVEKLTGVFNWISNLNPVFITAATVFAAVAAAIALIAGPILMLIGFLPSILAGFAAVKIVFAAVATAVGAISAPVLIVIGVIAALIAIFVYLWKTNEGFRDAIIAIWGQIKEGFRIALEFIKGIVKTVMTEVTKFFRSQLAKIKAFWSENGAQIMALVKLYFGNIWAVIKMIMGLIKGYFQAVWPAISGVVKIAWGAMKLMVSNGIDLILGIVRTVMALLRGDWEGAWKAIKDTVKSIWGNIKDFFKSVDLVQIGKDIIKGLIKGIGSMIGAVGTAVKNIASNIKSTITSFLGIRSPSRVMRDQVGVHIGGGIAAGITKSTSKVRAAMTAQAKALKKSAAEAIKNLEVKFDTNKIGASKYINELKKIQNQYKLTGEQSRKVQKEIFQAGKVQVKQAGDFKKSITKINDGVTSADSKLLNKVRAINSKLKADIKKVNDSFKKELAGLASSIYNQVGLFDEVKSEKVDGNALLKNLRAQNQQFSAFKHDLGKIQNAGVSKAFIAELKAMGVGAADEINAIANMPKSMLDDYVKAWKQKHALANAAASEQLAKAKENTTKQINALTRAATAELSKAKTDWVTQLKKFAETAKALGDFRVSGKVLGKDVIAGLVNGLRSMSGPLADAAKTLAKSVASTIKSTLKIKSPSRVLMEIGRYTGEGLAQGIADMRGMVARSAEELASAAVVKPDLSYATPNANYGSLSAALSGEVNVNQRESMLVGAIASLEDKLANLVVEMDGKTVGVIVAPTVSEEIDGQKNGATRGGGRRRIR